MRILKKTTVLLLLVYSLSSYSQVSISDKENQQPHPSAVLDLISNDKGFLMTRLTESQRDAVANPSEALMIFNKTKKCIEIWVDGSWHEIYCLESEDPIEEYCDGLEEVTFMYNGQEVTYRTVGSTKTGYCWLDRNLGAVSYDEGDPDTHGPSSKTDINFYGDIFQWGRADDGHQVINWIDSENSDGDEQNRETSILATNDQPGHANFIKSTHDDEFDWRTDNNTNRWNADPIVNNPCPDGWRVPTEQEWANEAGFDDNGWSNSDDAFASDLKLTVAGFRDFEFGALRRTGDRGLYWSSTVSDGATCSMLILFDDDLAMMDISGGRAGGDSVRCIKDN